jgi:hypothetical protein
MTMLVATLDILTKKAHFDPQVARAIAEAIALETGTSRESLATKQDLTDLRNATKQDLTDLRNATKQEIAELRHETKQDIAELKLATQKDFAALKGEFGGLRAEFGEFKGDLTRQMYMAILGQMAVLIGIAYFFVTHVT